MMLKNSPHIPVSRTADDVAAMAVVARANLAQLRTAGERLQLSDVISDAAMKSPGSVLRFREALIDHRRIRGYGPVELQLRLREVWGQHCLLCWALRVDDPCNPPSPELLGKDVDVQCGSAIGMKTLAVEGALWRLRYEQRRRADRDNLDRKDAAEARLAERIEVSVFGKAVGECDDESLVRSACEHAGMLAAARWVGDRRWEWGQAGIMDVDDEVFAASYASGEGDG